MKPQKQVKRKNRVRLNGPREEVFPFRPFSERAELRREPDRGRGSRRLRRWEWALALSLTLTLLQGLTLPKSSCWWGVIFPQLLPGGTGGLLAAVETLRREGAARGEVLRLLGGGGNIELRFFLLDWLSGLFC